MRQLLNSVLILLVFTAPLAAQTTLRSFNPPGANAKPANSPAEQTAGTQPAVEPTSEFVVEGTAGNPTTQRILVIDNPGVTAASYAVRGQVSFENVATGLHGEQGYLEMWSHFPDGSAYFSRTLGESGPMEALVGTSVVREFVLPFYNKPGNAPPAKLIISVVLPGAGRVHVQTMHLLNGVPDLGVKSAQAWWTGRQGGLLGALLGVFLGTLGAVVGICNGFARTRRLVIPLLWFMFVFCTTCLLAGIVAVSFGQPYAVYYGLLLCGVIGTVLSLGLIPAQRKMMRQVELRKMAALDAS